MVRLHMVVVSKVEHLVGEPTIKIGVLAKDPV